LRHWIERMYKFKKKYLLVTILTAIVIIAVMNSVSAFPKFMAASLNANAFIIEGKDTTIPIQHNTLSKDSTLKTDSLKIISDTIKIDTFSLKLSKDTLEAPVKYSAGDSVVGLVDEKKIILYDKAKADYQDVSLNAPVIELDQDSHTVNAKSSRDSIGGIKDYAKMKQGETEYQSEGMQYNFKTKKGVTKGTITQQGEMYVHADIAKKIDERTMYTKGAFFTTCNLDKPHFGFRANHAKIINKKLAVTGPIRPEFDSVPIPIYLPFGIYPLYQGRHSGFMAPSFETNDQMGLGLANMGYYRVINNHWDVKVYGNIYSYGSWQVNVNPTYNKLYKYRGSFNFGLQNTQRGQKGDPDFYKSKTYNLTWAHSSDQRARPGTSFSANVNASSTNYNRNIPNNNTLNFQNVLGSSIAYSKTWQDKPYNLTVSANHNQNNQSRLVSINLPDIGFTVSTLYPFQKKESAGSKKWYEQFGIGYQASFRNAVSFYDSVNTHQVYHQSLVNHLLDTLQWGSQHSIPISLTLPPILGGAVIVSPSISYSFEIVDRKVSRYWDNNLDSLMAVVDKTPAVKQNASFGIGFNTSLFGTYQFGKKSKVIALRHVVKPTFGLNYTPDLNQKFTKAIQVDSSGSKAYFNELDGLYTTGQNRFLPRKFGGITFGLDNSLEMKMRNKKKQKGTDSTATEEDKSDVKKVRLIEGFGFNGSYNLFADSMKLSPISMYFRTNLFEKININASASLTPYELNKFGNPSKNYAWQGKKFSLGSITSASVSMSTSFQSKPKDAAKEKSKQEAINKTMTDPMLQADQQRLLDYMRQNPAEFVDFNTQWQVSLSYSLTYSKGYNYTTNRNENRITSSANLTGSFNLSPKWNLSMNGYYDFNTKKIQTFSMSIARDLHCWQMAINISPIGLYKFYSFTISPKAGILQDLKINRNRSFYTGYR
jgi:LPS-assembly protein